MNRRQVLKTVLTAADGASLSRSGRILAQDAAALSMARESLCTG